MDKDLGLRVFLAVFPDGGRVGFLMRKRELLFDRPPPAAYGLTETDVLNQLEVSLLRRLADDSDELERYLWNDEFSVRQVKIGVHPAAFVEKQPVVGKREIPLRLSFAWSKLESGAYRVVLPRFRWWFIVEELELAAYTIRHAVSWALVGENPAWVYDFREAEREYVKAWLPESIGKRGWGQGDEDEDDEAPPPELAKVAEELVRSAARRKLRAPIGSHALEATLRGFVGRQPLPSLLLIGGPGVGKTTLVTRLAHLALRRRREKQSAPRIWSTSADRILAGMIYLGMWQERCIEMVRELSHEGDWLYVGQLSGILQRQSDGSSIADLLLPALRAREISLIAECHPEEVEELRRRAPALLDCLEPLRVAEPALGELPPLVEAQANRSLPGVKLHPRAVMRALRHLSAFDRAQLFPGKAFRFVEWIGRQPDRPKQGQLFPRQLSELYASYSGLPVELISDELSATPEELSAKLRRVVIGQDHACDAVGRVMARLKAGLNDPERPVGSLLLVGPTGVGKTELAKQVARLLYGNDDRLVRFDMSEFGVPGAAGRLLEVGRGVRSLAEQVRKQPLSVVLLDEIEKAHAETFDLLLGVLGEGRLRDSLGRVVDFRMTLILMTSNLGVGDSAAVGFGAKPRADFTHAVRDHFRPELFNRIDEVLSFRRLGETEIEQIVGLELEKAQKRAGLLRRQLELQVTPGARALLAKVGVHPKYGARPLKREIEERLITPLAARLARDPELKQRTLKVVANRTELVALPAPEQEVAVSLGGDEA